MSVSTSEFGSRSARPFKRIEFTENQPLADAVLQDLYRVSWGSYPELSWQPVLEYSLGWVAALREGELVGFVNVAWDGRLHAFLMDPAVHPRLRRHGVGTELVRRAAALARRGGCNWLHVDYEAQHDPFYRRAGFTPTAAGLINLVAEPDRLRRAARPRSASGEGEARLAPTPRPDGG
jgi:GNAT superfamily N-acetyltransferase